MLCVCVYVLGRGRGWGSKQMEGGFAWFINVTISDRRASTDDKREQNRTVSDMEPYVIPIKRINISAYHIRLLLTVGPHAVHRYLLPSWKITTSGHIKILKISVMFTIYNNVHNIHNQLMTKSPFIQIYDWDPSYKFSIITNHCTITLVAPTCFG
jgi:hypothetical protein